MGWYRGAGFEFRLSWNSSIPKASPKTHNEELFLERTSNSTVLMLEALWMLRAIARAGGKYLEAHGT